MRIYLKKREPLSWSGKLMIVFTGLLFSIILSSVIIVIVKGNPINVWLAIFYGSIGSRFAVIETIVKTVPLLFTGLAVAVAFRIKFWNIGAEGQLYAGGLAAAAIGILPIKIPTPIHIALVIIGGFIAGGVCASVAGYLKIKLKVNEVVTTILMNYIIILLISTLLDGPWRDLASGWPHSPPINNSARFPILIPGSRFHLGIIFAIIVVLIVYVILEKSILGYEINAIGGNPIAAYFTGIPRDMAILTTAFISGGIAGLAGVNEVCAIQYYLHETLSTGYGYAGVVIAMLGVLNPIGVVLGAFYFAMIINGAEYMSRTTGVPIFLTEVIQGITLITILAVWMFNEYKITIVKKYS